MTPMSADPSLFKIMTWLEFEATFQPVGQLSENVLSSEDYAIKVLHSSSPDFTNELRVMNKLNTLCSETSIFGHAYGYILSPDPPRRFQNNDDEWTQTRGHYAYLLMEPFEFNFFDLPDEPKANEDFFFEILIGLYYARKAYSFCHWDIHQRQLMFNTYEVEQTRSYRIGADSDAFYVTISSCIDPKLVDFGKSAINETGITTEELKHCALWKDPRHFKLWNKSDIYHLALIFAQRDNLSLKFRTFLDDCVLPTYATSMYAKTFQSDCSTNYANIEELLRVFFCQKPICE
jgi:hypothetical protein